MSFTRNLSTSYWTSLDGFSEIVTSVGARLLKDTNGYYYPKSTIVTTTSGQIDVSKVSNILNIVTTETNYSDTEVTFAMTNTETLTDGNLYEKEVDLDTYTFTGMSTDQSEPVNLTLYGSFETKVTYLLSKDGKTTFQKWDGTSWIDVAIADIYTQGMTKAEIEAIASFEYETWFKHGKIDIAIGLQTSDPNQTPLVESMTFNYPPNQAVDLTNFVVDTSDIRNKISFTFDMNDVDNDDISYRILFNGNVMKDWETINSSSVTGVYYEIPFNYTDFIVGTNPIKIEMLDEKGLYSDYTRNITVLNTNPLLVISNLDEFNIQGVLDDSDSDQVRWRLYINGNLIEDWSTLAPPPLNINYTWGTDDVNSGAFNNIELHYEDGFADGGVYSDSFYVTKRTKPFGYIIGRNSNVIGVDNGNSLGYGYIA